MTCPVVDAVVKRSSRAVKLETAVAAIQNDKISKRDAAERFGVSLTSLHRHLAQVSTVPDGTVDTQPTQVTGRDGKVRRTKQVSPEEVALAWQLRDEGVNTAEIARRLDRNRSTVATWFTKARPEALQQGQPPMAPPAPAPTPASSVVQPAPKPEAVEPKQAAQPPVLGALAKELLKQVDNNLLRPEAAVAFKALVVGSALVHKYREQVQKTYVSNGPACMEGYFKTVHQTLLHDRRLSPLLEVLELPTDGTLEQLLDALQFHSRRIYESAGVILGLYRIRTTAPPLPCVIENEQKQAEAA